MGRVSRHLRAKSIAAEVTNACARGFRLIAGGHEYSMPFSDYPAFQEATVEQIFNLREIARGQFHRPDLDADIELGALEHPEDFPLVWREEES